MNRPWGNQFNVAWTEAQDGALRKHLLDGLSSSQTAKAINAEFGTTYTRNSVIGRANRTGAERRVIQTRKKYKRIKPAKPRKPKEPPMTKSLPPQPLSALRTADVIPLHLPLLELGDNMCRWPYGSGPFVFCGHPTFDGCSYCTEHSAISVGWGTYAERVAA